LKTTKKTLPKRQLKPFDGSDITQYSHFINSFLQLIHAKCETTSECLHFLEHFTEGNARVLVQSVVTRDPEESYNNALALLEEEYGNEYKVGSTYLEKLDNWPSIKSEDVKGLNELSIFLLTCRSNMESMSVLNQLNSPKQIRSIVMKLPFRLREKWRDIALDLQDENRSVDFRRLVSFVRRQSRLMSQPLFGDIRDTNIKKNLKVFSTLQDKENECKYFNKIVFDPTYKFSPIDNKIEPLLCKYCQVPNHDVINCISFSKLSYSNKLEYVYRCGLCYSCLSSGHTSQTCLQKLTCEKCNKLHPTILHRN